MAVESACGPVLVCLTFENRPMSPTIASLLALTLALPVVLFIAVSAATGVNLDLISGGFTFFVVAAAVTAMIFEIKRLADT